METPCPNREQLRQMLLGFLPEGESEQIEQHLFECQSCVSTLLELGAGDTLIEAMRAQPHVAAEMGAYRNQVRLVVDRWIVSRGAADATPAGSAFDEPTSKLSPHGTQASDHEAESLSFLAPPQSPDELGRLGIYRVLRVVGSGGMGIVFEAEDPQLKRRVALKAMKPALAASTSSRRRFVREAQAAASVQHDHIVPIYQVGEDRGIPFIAMPLLRGETLAERLQRSAGTVGNARRGVPPAEMQTEGERGRAREGEQEEKAEGKRQKAEYEGNSRSKIQNPKSGALPVTEVLRIGREIATGLDAAHQMELIHRDIKPGNIWLEAGSGRVKILDFGLARAVSTEEQLTHTGALIGTPSYMAPEQGRSHQIDARADLFSLGCVFYHMATGTRPFVGHDALATLLAVTTHEPSPPRELDPDLPQGLNDLIVCLLCKDPAGRPQTAREVAERLEQIGLRVHSSGFREKTDDETALENRIRPPPPRRRGLIALAAYSVAFAALVLGIVIVIKNRDGKAIATVKTNGPAEVEAVEGIKVEFKLGDEWDKAEGERQKTETEPTKTGDQSSKTSPENPKPDIQNRESYLPPLSRLALVQRPATLAGVKSWSIESAAPVNYVGADQIVTMSPDGRFVACGSRDGHVRVFAWANTPKPKLVKMLIGHEAAVYKVDWSRDGRLLASADVHGQVRVWNVENGWASKTISKATAYLHFSPDSSKLAIVATRGIYVFDSESGALLASFDPGSYSCTMAWAPDGARLATADQASLKIWDAGSGDLDVEAKFALPIYGKLVAWSPDGDTLVTAPRIGEAVQVWDADDFTLRKTRQVALRKTLQVPALNSASPHWLDQGTTIGLQTDRGWEAWNVETGKPDPARKDCCGVARSVDGTVVCNALPNETLVDALEVHDAHKGARINFSRQAACAAMSPDGRGLAIMDDLNHVWLWDNDGRIDFYQTSGINSIVMAHWTSDRKSLLVASPLGTKMFTPRRDGWLESPINIAADRGPGDRSPIMAVSTDASRTAFVRRASNQRIEIWDLLKQQKLEELDPMLGAVRCLEWSPDATMLAVGTNLDSTGHGAIYNVGMKERVAEVKCTIPPPDAIRWSPNGATLAWSGNDDFIRFCDKDGDLLFQVRIGVPHDGCPLLAWSHKSDKLWITDLKGTHSCLVADGTFEADLNIPVPHLDGPLWGMSADSSRFVIPSSAVRICDTKHGELEVAFVPLRNGHAAAISSEGHWRGTDLAEQEIVYVVETDAGQQVLSPREFAQKYGWKNDPSKVGLPD